MSTTFEGVIRFHRKSRTGCLTCRKRKIKCDEAVPICKNCHRRELACVQRLTEKHERWQQQQASALYKPLTSPVPSSFTVDPTSLQMVQHYIDVTSRSSNTNPIFLDQLSLLLPKLLFGNPVCMHGVLALTALHLGRLYEPSSTSDSQNWIARASAHRRAATRLTLSPSVNPATHYVTVASLSVYTIASSLSSSSSSPETIFSLVTLLHNIWSPLKQLVHADPWLQGWNFGRQGPSVVPSALDSSNGFLAPLHRLYDTPTDLDLDREELDDPDIRQAYRMAVHGLFAMYSLTQMGFEGRSMVSWPALVGKRFVGLLNKRRQRALVVLYYYLMTLRNLRERFWWASEVGRWVEYVYGLIDERWREWLREVPAEKGRVVIKKNSVY